MNANKPVDGSAVALILNALGETETKAVAQVVALLDELGEEACLSLVGRARELHREGVMLTQDGTPRSLGGVFFALARGRLGPEARKEIFAILPRRIKQGADPAAAPVPPPPPEPVADSSTTAVAAAPENGSARPSSPPPEQPSEHDPLDLLDEVLEDQIRARLPKLVEELVEALMPLIKQEAKKLISSALSSETPVSGE